MISRLLPGDRAPALHLSQALNKDHLPEIVFDRTSIVVLWNGGCGYCHSFLEHISDFETKFGVPCFGIAIMVLNVEATRSIARSLNTNILLALEDIRGKREGLPRGLVTRAWFEPSGYGGLPTAFIVDQTGRIVWIGHEDIEQRLNEVQSGKWDVELARNRWRTSISDQQIAHSSMNKDILNALVIEGAFPAKQLLTAYEREEPELGEGAEYNILKLDVLASDPAHREEAEEHYLKCVDRFAKDRTFHLQLAELVTRVFPQDEKLLLRSLEKLTDLAAHEETQSDGKATFSDARLYVCLAQTHHLLGQTAEAKDAARRAVAMSDELGNTYFRDEVAHILPDRPDGTSEH